MTACRHLGELRAVAGATAPAAPSEERVLADRAATVAPRLAVDLTD